jgi:hypothetical protein
MYISRVEEEHTESLQKCIYFSQDLAVLTLSEFINNWWIYVLSASGRCLLYCKPIKVDIEVCIAKI